MRATSFLLCAHLRTLGLDSSRQHTAAEIKAAFLEKAKSTHPDAGGNAEHFRQLKDAYDALRVGGGAAGRTSYTDPFAESGVGAATATHPSHREHIYTERYNDGDAKPQPEKHTWDYGSGTRYANNSTRSFYRPYNSNYYDPSATGFTREEVARAELAMRLHMLRRILWNCLIYGSALYLMFEYLPAPKSSHSTDYELGLDARERRRREREQRLMQPHLQESWSDTKKARYLEEWNNRIRDREHVVASGLSAPFSEAGAAQAWSAASTSLTLPASTTSASPSALSSLDTYCDMAEEDIEVD